MNNKEFNKLKQFEWQEYAKRTHKTFIISVFIDVEGQALKKELGFECKNQIHHFNEKYLYFFRPKKEIDEANNFFLKILQDKSKLNNILIKSKEKNEEAKNILIKYGKNSSELEKDFTKIISKIIDIIVYTVVFSFHTLTAADKLLSEKEKRLFKKEIEKVEELRKTSTYGAFTDKIFPKIWRLASKKTAIPTNLLSQATWQEIACIFNNKCTINKQELEKRNKECLIWRDVENNSTRVSTNTDLLKQLRIEKTKENNDLKLLKGQTAQKGKAVGKVKIVNEVRDVSKVKKGDIIISINTNPSILPAIMKCAAIVTDEGGLTCHAAIISRELKKPCITGTKIATQVFQDNDLVEVDANKGVIKKI